MSLDPLPLAPLLSPKAPANASAVLSPRISPPPLPDMSVAPAIPTPPALDPSFSEPKPLAQSKLGFAKFGFVTLTKAEKEAKQLAGHLAAIARRDEIEDERERIVELKTQAALQKKADNRAAGRRRTTLCRQRRKLEEMANGIRDPITGKPVKPAQTTTSAPAPADATVPSPPLGTGVSSSTATSSTAQASPAADSASPDVPMHTSSLPGKTPLVPNPLAEASRPFRAAKAVYKAKKKPQGRKATKVNGPAKRMHWKNPLIWRHIAEAARRAGYGMSPIEIVRQARHLDSELFARLDTAVVSRWIDRSGYSPRWKDSVLAAVAQGHRAGGQTTRVGILAAFPEVLNAIRKRLENLRASGTPLIMSSMHGMIQGIIIHMAPEIFETVSRGGHRFTCSLAFVYSLLHTLGFSPRRPTRPAQHTPADAQYLGWQLRLRLVHVMDQEFIPIELVVNSDQTQSLYAYGSQLTWAETGSRQVSVVGQDEKRAFTLFVGVSLSGVLLPFQAIYHGQTERSLPRSTAPGYDRAMELGFRFEPSKSDTYWSTQQTMRDYVDHILMPYFESKRVELGLPDHQRFVWLIDCWKVHISREFLGWMKATHPRIQILYVPAGCTGLFQPCDVGIQRVLKHALKRASHMDVIKETLHALEVDKIAPEAVMLDKRLGTMRDRSVMWLLKAYDACNNPALVRKVSILIHNSYGCTC